MAARDDGVGDGGSGGTVGVEDLAAVPVDREGGQSSCYFFPGLPFSRPKMSNFAFFFKRLASKFVNIYLSSWPFFKSWLI